MSSELLIALTALFSTSLGASIPILGKFIELRVNKKSALKEKHQEVIRIILSDFLPIIDHVLYSAKDYFEVKDVENISFNLERLNEIDELYIKKIKDSAPLELISDLGELNFSIRSLFLVLKLERSEGLSFHYDEIYLEAVEYYNNLKTKITKTYL
ncbi:MAG: hypothetical protein ACQEV0_08430 [Bacillota bacterium]